MNVDPDFSGSQGVTREDVAYTGSTFADVRAAIFANAYYRTWGAPGEPALPVYDVTLRRALMGALTSGQRWGFQQAANRTVDSFADLRWGPDRKGFRRILHPNGVCLTGLWEIDGAAAGTEYTGYFAAGSRGLIVGRYSTCCTETRRGRTRSPSLVGKIYPTTDERDTQTVRPANFITQEDLGGTTRNLDEAELRNAPDVTPARRGAGLPVFMLTGFVLLRADKEPTIRQLHEIAELGKPSNVPTRAPEFMRLMADPAGGTSGRDGLDFRDEILGRIYDRGNPTPQRTLTFHIDVSDEGRKTGTLAQRLTVSNWKRIGRIVFREAVASYNGDFVIHFHHPIWRDDRNNPASVARPRRVLRPAS